MAFSRLGLMALLVAATLTVPQAAAADDVAKAKKLFKQAEKQFAKKKFDEALKLYQQAYENKPLAGFHLNMGQCFRNLAQYDKAIEQYNLYLQKAKSDKRKDEVNGLIKLCEAELAKQAPPPVEPEPTPAPEETPPELTKQPAPEPEPKPEARSRGLNPLFFWGGVGLTGAMVLTGTITGAVALSKSSDFNDPATPSEDLQDLKDSGSSMKTASTVTFVLAGVAAAGTAALYFFTDFGSKETSVAAAPIEGGGLVVMGGRF
jgi:tetratricopeptide (TPR) repeat protein